MDEQKSEEKYVRMYKGPCNEKARDPNYANWERVVQAALGNVQANGHAPFGAGELERILGAKGPAVSNAIRLAKDKHYLDESSNCRCLVPNPEWFGGWGGTKKPCKNH